MSSIDDLGDALQCVMGARQALRRVLEADVDDTLVLSVHQIDIVLGEQYAQLALLSNWRREAER